MFELAGLSTFLDIFQKAFGLIEKRKDQKRQLFNEIVEPVYTELTVVVGDYYGFFRGFRDDLSETEMENWPTVLSEGKKKREEIVLARNKVLGITRPFLLAREERKGKYDELLYNFAEAINDFFYESDNLSRPVPSFVTGLFVLIDCVVAGSNEEGKRVVISDIGNVLWHLEDSWRRISAAYGELRVFCLR